MAVMMVDARLSDCVSIDKETRSLASSWTCLNAYRHVSSVFPDDPARSLYTGAYISIFEIVDVNLDYALNRTIAGIDRIGTAPLARPNKESRERQLAANHSLMKVLTRSSEFYIYC
jgi:hypothetical protein